LEVATFLGHHVAELGLLFQNHHPTSLCKKLGVLIAHCTISIFFTIAANTLCCALFQSLSFKKPSQQRKFKITETVYDV